MSSATRVQEPKLPSSFCPVPRPFHPAAPNYLHSSEERSLVCYAALKRTILESREICDLCTLRENS